MTGLNPKSPAPPCTNFHPILSHSNPTHIDNMGPCNCWTLLRKREVVHVSDSTPPIASPPAAQPTPPPPKAQETNEARDLPDESSAPQLRVSPPSRSSVRSPIARPKFTQSSTSDFSQGSHPVSQRDSHLVAGEIWVAAYRSVREDESLRPLVENYELFFNAVLWPKRLSQTQDTISTSEHLLSMILVQHPGLLLRHYLALIPRYTISVSIFPLLFHADECPAKEHVYDCHDLINASGADPTTGEAHFREVAQSYAEATKKHATNSGIVSSAVQFVQKTKDVVGSALSVYPAAAMAWAGICLVILPVIINNAEQIAAKQIGFSYIMSRFTWYEQVVDLLDREYWKSQHGFSVLQQGIRDEIVSLYKLLIEYQLRAYYAYCRRLAAISRDFLKLDDWEGMISDIKSAEVRLQEYIDLNFDQHLMEKLHTISEDAIRKQRNDMLHKFKFPDELPYDVYQAYLDSIDAPELGTGHGVLSHPRFLEWASGNTGVLLLTGIPGSGKSVLAKAMLTELPKVKPTTVCSFFFKDDGRGQNMATTALCRVLDELFSRDTTLIDRFSSRLQHLLPQEVRCNLDLLWAVLADATSELEPGDLTIVLDALDECDSESAEKLWKKMGTYVKSSTTPMKFMITTRPVVSTNPEFDFDHAVVIKMNEDSHCLRHLSEDIEHVVASRFERFAKACIRDETLKEELKALVRPKEDRTYLYVKLLFDCLELRVKDGLPRVPRDWITSFKTLPANAREAYSKFLERVRESHRNDVKLMLQFVVAATRPLTVREINIALNIRDCAKGNPEGLGLQPEEFFRDWILDACKFFLDIYKGRVYFIHQTAKEYLLGCSSDELAAKPDWLGRFSIEDCHSAMAESCCAYLSLPFKSKARFSGLNGSPRNGSTHNEGVSYHLWDFEELEFSNYATVHWQTHVHHGQVLVHPLWKGTVPPMTGCVADLRTLQSCEWRTRAIFFPFYRLPSWGARKVPAPEAKRIAPEREYQLNIYDRGPAAYDVCSRPRSIGKD